MNTILVVVQCCAAKADKEVTGYGKVAFLYNHEVEIRLFWSEVFAHIRWKSRVISSLQSSSVHRTRRSEFKMRFSPVVFITATSAAATYNCPASAAGTQLTYGCFPTNPNSAEDNLQTQLLKAFMSSNTGIGLPSNPETFSLQGMHIMLSVGILLAESSRCLCESGLQCRGRF